MKVRAFRFEQNGNSLFATVLPAGDIAQLRDIDIWQAHRPPSDQGYQRSPSRARVKEIARFIARAGQMFPNSILLNSREPLHYEPIEDGWAWLELPSKLWLVDGQHRQLGLEAAGLLGFPLVVIIMDNCKKYQEMRQFHIINTRAKKVPTDLAIALLEQYRAEGEEGEEELVQRDLDYLERAKRVADLLNQSHGSCWEGAVRYANEPKKDTHLIRIATLAKSLEPTVRQFFRYKDETLAEWLDSFWGAIRDLLEDAFEDPRQYMVQNSQGVRILHKVAPQLFTLTDRSLEAMKAALGQAFESLDVDANDWHKQNPEGKYTEAANEKAFSRLAREIVEHLPEPA